ncbi:MAG: hypothetical protein ACJ8GN_12970 [Longimicrobiaceae bacterium]
MTSGPPEPGTAPGTTAPPAVWPCFFRSVSQSLELRPSLAPMPPDEDHAHPSVRAMQRARRHAWLHARYHLHWSMFESIRISVRLAEAFTEWARDGAPDVDALAGHLEAVEHEARQPCPVSEELRFVDRLMRVANTTDLHLADMEIAMEAYCAAGEPRRACA